MLKKFIFISLTIFFLAAANLYSADKLIKIETEWTVTTEGMANQNGITYTLPGTIPSPKNRCFWLTSDIQVPAEFQNTKAFLELGTSNAALEIYINDVLVAKHGTIEPRLSVNHVSNTVFEIPEQFKKDGHFKLSIRGKTDWSHAKFEQMYFTDENRFYKCTTSQDFLNTIVYYMMAAVCFFLCIYFLLQMLSDHREHASLYFSWSLFFIGIYFFDMATSLIIMPANLQLSISRLCLLLSISTLAMFIYRFFGRKSKVPKYIIFVIDFIFAILFYIGSRNTELHETIFTLSLAPVFIGIIFIYITLLRSFKDHKTNSKVLLFGITAGMTFGVHDILFQAMGKAPFAWLQGFSFFFIDITMFIVVSMDTIKHKRAINIFAETTSEQKGRLDDIMEKAKQLSEETSNIAQTLNESVKTVAEAAEQSAKQASEIGVFILEQNKAIKNTSDAVTNLVDSVRNVAQEVENESQAVDSTVKETTLLIEGINSAALGVENAANFTSNLGKQTQESTQDISKLVECMQSIKNSSTEIQNIVKVVSDFFHKTNMLAMNASIEAAHSGVAGKGFSVIAHEIKKLSEASNEQADKIKDIITQIDENITIGSELSKNLETVLLNAASQASSTAITVNDSVRTMDIQRATGAKITEATGVMTEFTGAVKEETQQQYTIAQQVSENMMQLSEYADNTENAVNDIIYNNSELSKQTEELRDLVSRAREAASELAAIIHG